MLLVLFKDLNWLIDEHHKNPMKAVLLVSAEITYILTIILGIATNLMVSFSRNLRMKLEFENTAMDEVGSGDFNCFVPVGSSDEFGMLAQGTNKMIGELRFRTEELHRTQDVTIMSLASLAETRDNETGAHILRTQRYVKALAEQLSTKDKYKDDLPVGAINLLYKSAPLHDIGKVGIPDSILLKPGRLTDEEFEIMKKHAQYGKETLERAEKQFAEGDSFLCYAREIAYSHHEKWDGSGYPQGLVGSDIPLSGRLMAVADVYDALISKRVYKDAFSHEKSKGIILNGVGKHFDPDVIDAFLAIEDEFIRIADEFSDEKYNE